VKRRFEFPDLLQAFFTDRLMTQKQASSHTVASYRDTFRLLIEYIHQTLKKQPATIRIGDLNTDCIVGFLNHLEKTRGVTARSRNQRLGAIRSFFRYVAFKAPEHSGLVQQILAIPCKRHDQKLVDFLTREEIEAILQKPDRNTWIGRRDHALILVAVQTGMRVSELTGLCRRDLAVENAAHVRCLGKGRRDRCIPLTKQTVAVLRSWLKEVPASLEAPLFPNHRGRRMSSDCFQYLLSKYAVAAGQTIPSLKEKRVSPHVLRHSTAIQLLLSGVDRSLIALWLGHQSVETTQIYLNANLAMKEAILKMMTPVEAHRRRFRPDDALLSFLKAL
jgi:site-specific recombinase XerD